MEPQFVSIAQFAALSGVSESTVRRRIKDDTLPARQFGCVRCRWLIPRDALDLLRGAEPVPRPQPVNPPSPPPVSPERPRLAGPRPGWMR